MLALRHRSRLAARLAARLTLRLALAGACALLTVAPLSCVAQGATASAAKSSIPARLSDQAFWQMVSDFSEPGGFFRSDNFVSNETTFQHVIPDLLKGRPAGGVYMGVGPDQNFTYIVALRPKIAFIVDIRRQNLLQHLLYKALMELSSDRTEFLSRLFSRPRPAGLETNASAPELFQAYTNAIPDSTLFRRNVEAVRAQLVDRHGFLLTEDDLRTMEYVYGAFFAAGPELTYSFSMGGRGQFFGRRMPTYGELMVETDADGERRSYLASEANYRILRDMQRNNLIVPLVGDFAGDKAIRSVAGYLRSRGATVTAFYTSNVEQYLFQRPEDWRRFFANVGALPLDSSSTFIRAVFNYTVIRNQTMTPGPRSQTMLGPITDQVQAVSDGRILTYYDVIQMSR